MSTIPVVARNYDTFRRIKEELYATKRIRSEDHLTYVQHVSRLYGRTGEVIIETGWWWGKSVNERYEMSEVLDSRIKSGQLVPTYVSEADYL